jgi:hypothetical protein
MSDTVADDVFSKKEKNKPRKETKQKYKNLISSSEHQKSSPADVKDSSISVKIYFKFFFVYQCYVIK